MSSDAEQLPMQPTYSQDLCVLRLPVSLTVTEAMEFRQTCQRLLNESPQLKQLCLDLSETTFIDSSGIGALVICRRLCQQQKIALRLREVGVQVMMALSMTDLDKVFTIEVADPEVAEDLPTTTERQLLSTHPSVTSSAKRAMDILGAVIGLGLTAVVAVPVAIAIKLDDGGPIFFSQTRCSLMGRRFRIWKFRSMVVNAEQLKKNIANQVEGPLFKNPRDPRITRVGHFLRKTSLDEFPQFWNVLKGEMSLVGTRPPCPMSWSNMMSPSGSAWM
jgi:anti-anti-sigma factor